MRSLLLDLLQLVFLEKYNKIGISGIWESFDLDILIFHQPFSSFFKQRVK